MACGMMGGLSSGQKLQLQGAYKHDTSIKLLEKQYAFPKKECWNTSSTKMFRPGFRPVFGNPKKVINK